MFLIHRLTTISRSQSMMTQGKKNRSCFGSSPKNALFSLGFGLVCWGSQLLATPSAIAQAPTTPTAPINNATVNVPNGCLNVRRTPSIAGEIYDCIAHGKKLKPLVKEENGWYQLADGGWVSKNFVNVPVSAIPPTQTTPPQTTSSDSQAAPRLLFFVAENPMRGEDVRRLQIQLNKYKLLSKSLVADGVFGQDTRLAVEIFQKQKGLKVDGVVGASTRTLLGL